jgi:hypothetical protein
MFGTAFFLAAAMVVGQGDVIQVTNRADFEAYCQGMQGRWFNEDESLVELMWPESTESGKKVTSYAEIKSVADGNALEGVWYAAGWTSKWLTSWDTAAKQIKKFGVVSDGTVWEEVRTRKGNNWQCSVKLTRPNGKVESFSSTLRWSEDGRTHTYTSEEGGDSAVYRRVSK